MSYLIKLYKEKIMWDLIREYNYKSVMQVPNIVKVIISVGCGKFFLDKKKLQNVISDLILITSQKPILIKSKKSIANFKIRKGNYIGIKVTLRNKLMYEFLNKLINIALPRSRDFRGLSKDSFDFFGNYNLGIKDHMIFPEVDYNDINLILGFNINIITSAFTKKEALFLLNAFNFPFKI